MQSAPVAFDWTANVVFSDTLAFLSAALTAAALALTGPRPLAVAVRAFILFALALILNLKPGWWIPAAAFYLRFELALRPRPGLSQV